MTREEATYLLNNLRSVAEGQEDEAINMAIESLSEPKTVEWVEVTNGRGGHECSNCHGYAPSYMNGDEYLSDFCPNCGAKMDKGGGSE